MTRRGTRIRHRRPPVTAGLDFTRPYSELYDEVVDRLVERWNEDHRHNPLANLDDEALERIYEKADDMVLRRLK